MDPTTVVPDPTTSPIETLSLVEKLYHSGAFFCLGIVGAFLALRYASKTWGWFEAGGKGAAIAAAVLGGLGVLIVPAMQGATPNLSMIGTAIGTVVALLMHPITPAKMAKAAGAATILAILMFAPGCGAPQVAAEKTAGTCVETAAIKAVEADITTAVTEGNDGWESIALAALTSVAPDAVVCVAQLVESLIKSKLGASPNGAAAAAAARAHQLVDDLQTGKRKVPRAPKTTSADATWPEAVVGFDSSIFIGNTIP